MKLVVNTTLLTEQPERIARQAGYAFHTDRKTGQESYVRRLAGTEYPRFHLYVQRDGPERAVFNLHLDQKKASYEGTHRHSGEYDGDLVAEEMARLKGFIVAASKKAV